MNESNDDSTLFAARQGVPVSVGAELHRKRAAALAAKAAQMPAGSSGRRQLEADAAAARSRIASPAWLTSNEGQNLRKRSSE